MAASLNSVGITNLQELKYSWLRLKVFLFSFSIVFLLNALFCFSIQEYLSGENSLKKYKTEVDSFICALMPNGSTVQIRTIPGGLLHTRDSGNLQYVTSASIQCGCVSFSASDIRSFAQSQVDYILGKNPLNMSYMVGFGSQYPQHLHHRGASIPSIQVMPNKVGCNEGYSDWYNANSRNPNVHVGAVVGGPDSNDQFNDVRYEYSHLEPTTYINAPLVGCLAGLIQRTRCSTFANYDILYPSQRNKLHLSELQKPRSLPVYN